MHSDFRPRATLADVRPAEPIDPDEQTSAEARGDEARRRGDSRVATELYLAQSREMEIPDARLCLKLAGCSYELGDVDTAFAWVARVVDAGDSFTFWMGAARLLAELRRSARPRCRRRVKAALTGTYTTGQLAGLLGVAALRAGIDLEVSESPFGQYRQDIVDPDSSLYRFEPDVVVIAAHEGAATLPQFSNAAGRDVDSEFERWAGLWHVANERSGAWIVQHGFVIRPDSPFGHLAPRLGGSRYAMMQTLNARIAEEAPDFVRIVDCDRIASVFGKQRWFDDRYWHLARQAVALDALPILARHTIGVMAASLGLSRKCLAFDLDNTIWGGVIGEDGVEGIDLGATPKGEAFAALQEHIVQLKERGVVLAVVSKNNESDARDAFTRHPDMHLHLDDVASFVANWDDKPANLRRVAAELGLGLDAIVFLDDEPVEREIVRQALPDVEVLVVPSDPVGSLQTLSRSLLFEPSTLTEEDRSRAAHYRARAETAKFQSAARSLDDFYRSLDMEARVAPLDELHLPRVVQLLAKTNQFNLTTRRHGESVLRSFMEDPRYVALYLKLRDRFADHGLVAVTIAEIAGPVMDIDTFLMSCRVIGRTVERKLMERLSAHALERGCTRLRGAYVPSARNQVVERLYDTLGFHRTGRDPEGSTTWEYDLAGRGIIKSDFIRSADAVE
jgi:FkbH-like protein